MSTKLEIHFEDQQHSIHICHCKPADLARGTVKFCERKVVQLGMSSLCHKVIHSNFDFMKEMWRCVGKITFTVQTLFNVRYCVAYPHLASKSSKFHMLRNGWFEIHLYTFKFKPKSMGLVFLGTKWFIIVLMWTRMRRRTCFWKTHTLKRKE